VNEVTLLTRQQIYLHIGMGYRYFVCGGAFGFDTIAAVQVCRLRASGAKINLILALPCRDQTAQWDDIEMLKMYQRIKGSADKIVYVNDTFTPDCMRERNKYMVDISSACIAYYSGKKSGGTMQTIHMAEAQNVGITNIYVKKTV